LILSFSKKCELSVEAVLQVRSTTFFYSLEKCITFILFLRVVPIMRKSLQRASVSQIRVLTSQENPKTL
jgi:hypothetical protein